MAQKFSSTLPEIRSDISSESGLSHLTVAIEEKGDEDWRRHSDLEDLAEKLREAKIFKEVIYVYQLSNLSSMPDLVLVKHDKTSEKYFIYACSLGFEGEMITIATIGLIPQVCRNRYTETFVLSAPSGGRTVEISMEYEAGSVLGWAALFYSFSDEWTLRAKEYDGKYLRAMKSAFEKKAGEVRQLSN